MKLPPPGILSIRAVNQYRRREIFSYLGLRYYLENSAARSDKWAIDVASSLVMNRSVSQLYRVRHFKEFNVSGEVDHRSLFVPVPSEALAEAVLLAECSRHPEVFQNPSCVFSYAFEEAGKTTGIFSHYMHGLRKRHNKIATACESSSDGLVQYTDIKEFYTSIPLDYAHNIWLQWASNAEFDTKYRELGEALIDSQATAGYNVKKTLLIGPMFSHLIANLALRNLDMMMLNELPAQCVRYVDDITIVGDSHAVSESLKRIENYLASELGLKLHDSSSEKSIQVSSEEWLKGRDDFSQKEGEFSWMMFVSDLKLFLILQPENRWLLQDAFMSEGFRIPMKDYSGAICEKSYVERLSQLWRKRWFRKNTQQVSIQSLLGHAKVLRIKYAKEISSSLDKAADLRGYARKRLVPKLRYCAGRLVYLAKESSLASIADSTESLKELSLLTGVMKTVSTGNLDQLLHMGTNAAQAAAQPLRAAGKDCNLSKDKLSKTEEQALAVFLLNGVSVSRKNNDEQSDVLRFAKSGTDLDLMKSKDPFIRNLACLHGISDYPRHTELLETAYDKDELITLDAVEQLRQSNSM